MSSFCDEHQNGLCRRSFFSAFFSATFGRIITQLSLTTMKFLRFNFDHPFKGKASLVPLSILNPIIKYILVDSKLSNLVEIPIDGCHSGKWRIILDWDYDGREFTHQEDFEVLKKRRVLLGKL
jgi:hypothetical protein